MDDLKHLTLGRERKVGDTAATFEFKCEELPKLSPSLSFDFYH